MVGRTDGRRATPSGRPDLALIVGSLLVLIGAVSPARGQIQWQSGMSELSGKSRAEVVETLATTGLRDGDRHVIVQFSEPVTPATRTAMAESGVELLGSLGNNAFFATVAAGGADAAALRRAGTLIDAQPVQRDWKLHRDLIDDIVREWAIVKADDLSADPADPVIGVYVIFHRDVDPQTEGFDVLEAYDARVRSSVLAINGLVVELPVSQVKLLAEEDAVQWIEPPLPRMSPINAENRERTGADDAQSFPYNLDGTGVNVLVYDAGTVRATHVDFEDRATAYDSSGMDDHATHVAGTVGSAGVAEWNNRGMAPGVTIISYGFEQEGGLHEGFLYTDPGDIEQNYGEAINEHGADISNNSIGTNTAPNGYPCEWEGNYGATGALIDTIVRGDGSNPLFTEPFRIVWANGNERSSGRCGTQYHTTAPPACAKNHITVGALVAEDDSMSSFSSWGPSDDDRIKPDICAPGVDVLSCSASSDTAYNTKSGTSMASPTVCGLAALLMEDYRAVHSDLPEMRNSTLKVLFAHTAVDLGNTGPDYQFGYGSVRIIPAIELMRAGNFLEDSVEQDEVVSVLVSVDEGEQLKVTLAWDDVPGTPNVMPVLVNDLDLRVIDPSSQVHYPWTLAGLADPSAPAVRDSEDHVNNIEQVVIDDPAPGVYRVEIAGYNVPEGPQPFSIAASPQLVACSSAGVVSFGNALYGCEATAEIRVNDCDLNTDSETIQTVTISVRSDSEPDAETVLLTETAPETADFRGTIPISVTDAEGVLLVADTDTLTATYIDADDGQGGTDVVVEGTAGVDCQGPVITNVRVIEIGSEQATVAFETNEPAIGTVRYGLACDALNDSSAESRATTEHVLLLTGLDFSTQYRFLVEAEDAQGNLTVDDSGGECYAFATPNVVYNFPMDADPEWDTEGQWAFGQPTGGGTHDGDPMSGRTGDNVYGYNLDGDYENSLPATYLTTSALDCTGLNDVTLTFWRWLGVESNSDFDEATIEVSNDGRNWTVIWRATDLGVDVSDSAWQYKEYDISDIADEQGTVYLRWGMGPTDGGLTYPGWNIDDVQIIATGGRLSIGFPDGLPQLLEPGVPTDIAVRVVEGEESLVPDTPQLHYRYYGGDYVAVPLTHVSGDHYLATLPPANCDATPEFYFSAEGTESGVVRSPATAPSAVHTAEVGVVTLLMEDSFEGGDEGWTVGAPDDDATTGIWNRNDPQGTEAQPENDHTPSPGTDCYVTDYRAGLTLGDYDIDDGKTTLISPVIDLTGFETAVVSYWRWYSNDTGAVPGADVFVVDISNDGGSTWVNAETVGPGGTQASGGWFYHEFFVSDFVEVTDEIQLRFVASDEGEGSLVEAALDDFRVTAFGCESVAGDGDFNGDGDVDLDDVASLQACFGTVPLAPGCSPGDMDGSGDITLADVPPFITALEAGGPN